MTNSIDILDDFLDQYKRHVRETHKPETNEWAINIILDDSDPQNPIFVEIENDKGMSIRIGNREEAENGLSKIRISIDDMIVSEEDESNQI